MNASGNLPADWSMAYHRADLWDYAYLDLDGPAMITIGAADHGEVALGAMQATLDLRYSPSGVFFTWVGFDEMDEVTGDDHA